MNKLLFAAFLMALLLVGCISLGGQPQNNTQNVTPPPPPPPAPKPTFSITSPLSGDSILAADSMADVEVSLSTSNLVIKQAGSAKKSGEGHFKIALDDGTPVDFYAKTYTLTGVAIGNHTISVELVNNDGSPYSPAIIKTATFEVKKQEPLVYVPQNYSVSIGDNAFNPSSISVKVGDSVTWTNNGKSPQSATCFVEGKQKFDTNVLGPGKSATVTFNETLQCTYYSTTFRMMTGNITVESNSG